LTFLTKNELDFNDWKTVGLLKSKKLHLTKEGKILIIYICNRMNVNRLSTKIKSLKTLNQKEEL